ncbi:MAG: hypothetical protein JF625_13590 [Inquilinus limosus]|uniref:Uncharacterized protein n=1 Tax=Inquilinus limosus TaxID=171674 RepID=A0A952FN12_9PROT|nr:hypothetical protein [Inquilinus limosus]
MDRTQSVPDSGEIKPTDPDMHWTGWALDKLREIVDLDISTKRMTAREQDRILRGAEMPDYPLMQSRLSRSVRLSIAMIERIRTGYLMRKAGRVESGEQERRRQRREQATETVVKAVAQPDEAGDVERVRSMVWESLVEDEILDVQLDTLSPEEFLREVCRKIGRPPPSDRPPQGWDDEAATGDALPVMIAVREPVEGSPQAWTESTAGRALSRPLKPDSS